MENRQSARYRRAVNKLSDIKMPAPSEERFKALSERLIRSCESSWEYLKCCEDLDRVPDKSTDVRRGYEGIRYLPNPDEIRFFEGILEIYRSLLDLNERNERYPYILDCPELAFAAKSLENAANTAEARLILHRTSCSEFYVGPVFFPRNIDSRKRRLEIDTALAIELSVIFRRYTAVSKRIDQLRFSTSKFPKIPNMKKVGKICYGLPCWKHVADFVNATFVDRPNIKRHLPNFESVQDRQIQDRVNRYLRQNPGVRLERWRLPPSSHAPAIKPTFGS